MVPPYSSSWSSGENSPAPLGEWLSFLLGPQQLLLSPAGLPTTPTLLLPSPEDFLQRQENASGLLNILALTRPNPSLTHLPDPMCLCGTSKPQAFFFLPHLKILNTLWMEQGVWVNAGCQVTENQLNNS